MEHLMPGFDILISQVRKTASFYVTSFALFLYHVVFDEHLKCLCKHGVKPEVTRYQCFLYMLFPVLILILLTLWMDGEFQRVLRITCRCKRYLCKRLFAILIKATAIGLLWVVSVLIDGDWLVCYERAMLPCKNNTTPSQEELEKQLETHFKRDSMVIGLGLVLGLLIATSILTAIPWRDICSNLNAKMCFCFSLCNCYSCTTSKCANCCMICKIKPYHRELFEENIWEQTEILIEKDLKRTANECVVLKSREILCLSNAAYRNIQTPPHSEEMGQPLNPTTHGGDRPTFTTPTTQGGDRPTSITPTTQGGDRPTSTTPTTQGGDRPTSTTPTTQGGGGATSTTPTTQGGGGATSTTSTRQGGGGASSSTHPELEDRVITLDNLDFEKISDLYSRIISSMFPEPPSSAASTAHPTP